MRSAFSDSGVPSLNEGATASVSGGTSGLPRRATCGVKSLCITSTSCALATFVECNRSLCSDLSLQVDLRGRNRHRSDLASASLSRDSLAHISCTILQPKVNSALDARAIAQSSCEEMLPGQPL